MSHFDVLKQEIADEGGTLVKTMGDAVMAVFPRPLSALKATLQAQERIENTPGLHGFQLKAGIHFGPCIAVTMNDQLDYFGSTVNVAARLQGLSVSDDVMISEAVYRDIEVARFVFESRASLVVERANVKLKGFASKRFNLRRLKRVKHRIAGNSIS